MSDTSAATSHAVSPLHARTAIVTGGGRGAGAAIAFRLAADGARVIVSARTSTEIEQVAGEIRRRGGDASAVACDVTDPRAIDELAAAAHRLVGRVDILVNNAGAATAAPLERTTLAAWNAAFAVNVTSAFLCLKAFVPGMVQAGWGRVVNIASTAALSGDRYICAYAASKHALLGLTRSVAAEVAAHGVTVNAVCPSFLATEMTEQSIARIVSATGRTAEDARAAIARRNPQNRLIDPDEVATAVAYLCSPAAAGVNGTTLVIDGGELRR